MSSHSLVVRCVAAASLSVFVALGSAGCAKKPGPNVEDATVKELPVTSAEQKTPTESSTATATTSQDAAAVAVKDAHVALWDAVRKTYDNPTDTSWLNRTDSTVGGFLYLNMKFAAETFSMKGTWDYEIHIESLTDTKAVLVDCQTTKNITATFKDSGELFRNWANHRELHSEYTLKEGQWILTDHEFKNVETPGGMKYCPNMNPADIDEAQAHKFY